MTRGTIGVDVDGVLHSYTSGWQGAANLPDPPVRGASEWLNDMINHFDVAIVSTRADSPQGRLAILEWLIKHGASQCVTDHIQISAGKPPCLIYIDDRGWRFTGANFPTVQQIHNARPWWKDAS